MHKKKLYSELLNETFHINVTTAALRTIDKMGGLDNYILYTKDHKLDSLFGLQLKARLKEVPSPFSRIINLRFLPLLAPSFIFQHECSGLSASCAIMPAYLLTLLLMVCH